MKAVYPAHPVRNALTGGLVASFGLAAAIYFGSGGLTRFDSPLAAYAAATVFAAFAFSYRYLMWIQRPATWLYFRASWALFFRPRCLVRNLLKLVVLLWNNIVIQKFIGKRSHTRWIAHMGMAWGCLLAFAITFPLSWGWVQFGVAPDGYRYQVEFMSMPQFSFDPNGPIGWLFFNGLNISATLVLVGIGFAMHRRVFSHGAHAVQSIENDLVPLLLLFSVSITGLMITASYRVMGGANFSFVSLLHAFFVILLLLWMPFGKLFHVIQRPAQLGVAYYKEAGSQGPMAVCVRSGREYQSQMHHDDLVEIMKQVDIDFGGHQNLSPEEKRKLVALNQLESMVGRSFIG
ncbi:MAG: MFS transporter [Armatimonadetes bacterium]|nr:MFS transporter [Armatimonadota bacterium]